MNLANLKTKIPLFSLILAVFILLTLSLQYPATLIFPMGGDSPPYIKSAQRVLNVTEDPTSAIRAFTGSRYPLTVAIFTTVSSIIPTNDWPIKFIWVMTIGQIMVGLALGFMLYRLAEYLPTKPNWQMATVGMSVWAFTPITLNGHFMAGTLGQLWSLAFLMLFFERLLAKKPKGAALMLFATLLTHPITAVVITLVMAVSIFPLWYLRAYLEKPDKKILWFLTAFLILSSGAVFFYLSRIENPIPHIHPGATFKTINDYLTSNIAFFVFLAPLGFTYLILKSKKISLGIFLLLIFFFLSFFLAFNDLIGFDIWTNRLHTFLIISISILSAVALPPLVNLLIKNNNIKIAAGALLLIFTGYLTWGEQQKLYNSYNTLNHYTGLDRVERKAVEWTNENLPPNSRIITTNKQNRNAEWIPVLTNHRHTVRVPRHHFFSLEGGKLERSTKGMSDTYFMFFFRREDPPENMLNRPDLFPVIYKSSGAIIFSVNPIDE